MTTQLRTPCHYATALLAALSLSTPAQADVRAKTQARITLEIPRFVHVASPRNERPGSATSTQQDSFCLYSSMGTQYSFSLGDSGHLHQQTDPTCSQGTLHTVTLNDQPRTTDVVTVMIRSE